MSEPKIQFTNVSFLNAEALGEPGNRIFRITASSGTSKATIWLEKEQLLQVALAVNQLLGNLPEESKPNMDIHALEAPESSTLDFKTGKIVLGYDNASGQFMIDAHDIETPEEENAEIRVWSNQIQIEAFANQALEVCTSGRPICTLCGGSIDPEGHTCPRTNGHNSIHIEYP